MPSEKNMVAYRIQCSDIYTYEHKWQYTFSLEMSLDSAAGCMYIYGNIQSYST